MPQSIIGLINQWTQSNLDIFPPSNIYNVLVGTNLNPTGFKFLVVGETKLEGDLTITGTFNGSISNIKVENKTDNNNYQLVFVDNDGNQIPLYTNNQITYNPSSNTFVVGNLTSNISTSSGYLTSNLSGLLQNNQLQNDDIIIDGINLELGSTNSQLALDLVNSTGYLTSNLVGLLQNNQLQNDDIIIDGINLELGSTYSQLALDATNFINLNPANINITNTTTNQNYYLVFCDSAGTNKILRLDNAGIKYNPSTKILTIDKILSTLDSQFERQINLTGNQTAILGRPQINWGGDAFSALGFSIRHINVGAPYLTELKSSIGDIQIESSGLITLFSTDIELKGNVGINTNTPSVSLDIDTTDAVKLPSGTTAERPTPSNGMIRYNSDNNDFEGYKNGAWNNLGGSSLWTQSGSNIYYNAGNVGIGISTPSQKLEVYGKSVLGSDSIFNILIYLGNTFTNSTQTFTKNCIYNDTTVIPYALFIANTDGGFTTNKEVSILFGIADSTDNVKTGNSICSISNDFNAITSDLVFKTNSTSNGYIAPTESMRITSIGNVGIGIIPAHRLHILGSCKFGDYSNNNFVINIEQNATYKYGIKIGGFNPVAQFGESMIQTSSNLHIDSAGNGPVGIGHIYLNFYNSGANTYVRNRIDISDKRIKKDIIKIEDEEQFNKTFEIIKNIGSYTYKYRDIYRENDLDQYGFIAQEVLQYYPVASKLAGDNCYLPNIMETLDFSYEIDDNNEYTFTIDYDLDVNIKYLFYAFKENNELFDYLENIEPTSINTFSYKPSENNKPVYIKLVLVGTYTNDKLGVSKDKLFQLGFSGVNGLIIENEKLKKEITELKNEIQLIKQHLNL